MDWESLLRRLSDDEAAIRIVIQIGPDPERAGSHSEMSLPLHPAYLAGFRMIASMRNCGLAEAIFHALELGHVSLLAEVYRAQATRVKREKTQW